MKDKFYYTLHSPNHNGGGAEPEFWMLSKVKSVYLLSRLAILIRCKDHTKKPEGM